MSTVNYIFYTSTGEMSNNSGQYPSTITVPELAALTPVGGGYLLGLGDGSIEYFPAGVRTPRSVIAANDEYSIAADGVASVTFPLPSGTDVTCLNYEHPPVTSAGEAFVYTSQIERIDVFQFVPPFPYIVKTVTITSGYPEDLDEYNASDV